MRYPALALQAQLRHNRPYPGQVFGRIDPCARRYFCGVNGNAVAMPQGAQLLQSLAHFQRGG